VSLKGRVVVVTGGARGMGRAIVNGFVAEGSKVVAIDRSWEGVDDLGNKVEPRKDALSLTVNLADEEQIAQSFRATMDAFGTVDVVVNNAGYRQRDVVPWTVINVLDIPKEDWQRAYDINIMAPLLMVKHFIGPMRQKRAGSIIQISSDSGVRGRPGNQPYGATKAALTNWSQSLADELKPDNIAVNCVFPAGTRTTGWEEQTRLAAERRARTAPYMVAPYTPESVVPITLFLAQQNAQLTGRSFPLADWNLEHGVGGVETWAAIELDSFDESRQYKHPPFIR